jgi:hypothetical protein
MMHNVSGLVLAYIDPGGGEFLLQILIGGIFAWIFRFRRLVFRLFRQGAVEKASPEPDQAIDPSK